MEYHKDDSWLFGQENTSNKTEGWSMVGFLICMVIVGVLLSGCDGQAAEATRESVMVAETKKEALMGHPCTYVAQCGNPISDCPVSRRKCVQADLTERKK